MPCNLPMMTRFRARFRGVGATPNLTESMARQGLDWYILRSSMHEWTQGACMKGHKGHKLAAGTRGSQKPMPPIAGAEMRSYNYLKVSRFLSRAVSPRFSSPRGLGRRLGSEIECNARSSYPSALS